MTVAINGNPGEKWRVFVAIEIPAEIRKRIAQHIARLRDEVPEVRATWSREENLHLTLKFLGNIPATRVEALSRAAEQSTRNLHPFELRVAGCGSFPPRGTPRVLWIGIDDQQSLLDRLYGALEDNCAEEGFGRERRPFNPHLTIARIRRPLGARSLAELHNQTGFERMAFAVEELRVIRSELSSEGSRYTVLSSHRLALL